MLDYTILLELIHTKNCVMLIKDNIKTYLKKTNKIKKKKIGMLELVDRFRLGRNGFITVQVKILLPIHERNNMIYF